MAIEDETTGPRLMAVMWAMSGASLLFMMLRYVFKRRSRKTFHVDDWVLAVSWLCLVLYSAMITTACRYGMGHHLSTLSHDNQVEAHRFLAVSYFFGTIGLPLSKSSFAITLLRLVQERWQKGIIVGITVTINVFLWVSAIFLFTSCTPVERIFDPQVPGTCLNTVAILHYNQFAAGYSAAMDFVLVLIPWYLLWGVNMRTVEKVGVCVAMSFGTLSGIAGAIRVYHMGNGVKWKDWTYNTDNIVWSAAETALVIIAASIPFLRTTQYVKKITQRSSEKASSGAAGLSFGLQGSGSSARGLTNWSRSDDGRIEENHATAMGALGASKREEALSAHRLAAGHVKQGGAGFVRIAWIPREDGLTAFWNHGEHRPIGNQGAGRFNR